MTRKTTQLPKANPGDYARWREEFEDGPYVRGVLAKFAPPEAELIRSLLFAVHLGPRQLTREQVRRIWPNSVRSDGTTREGLKTRINLTDYVILLLAARLKDKTRCVNEDIATLLTAAGIPGGRPGTSGWTAEAIKKKKRRATNDKNSFLVSNVGPRFQLRRSILSLAIARQPE
ncbi:MAG: hypothetical protein ACLP0H_19350 [Terriglobales bacterium]